MKKYRVEIVPEAEEKVWRMFAYLLFVLNSKQAYDAVKEDYKRTLKRLATMAGSIQEADEPELRERGLKKIFFEKHNYVLLYETIDGEIPVARVIKAFHTSEDYIHNV